MVPGYAKRLATRTAISVMLTAMICLATSSCAARGPVGSDQVTIDEWITAEVRRVLAEDSRVDAEEISVETRDGVVVLSGIQSSLENVRRALQLAQRVPRVRQVVNQIRVVPRQAVAFPALNLPDAPTTMKCMPFPGE